MYLFIQIQITFYGTSSRIMIIVYAILWYWKDNIILTLITKLWNLWWLFLVATAKKLVLNDLWFQSCRITKNETKVNERWSMLNTHARVHNFKIIYLLTCYIRESKFGPNTLSCICLTTYGILVSHRMIMILARPSISS